jgi:cbb3-type cytochrome c oxidase subunit III
MASKRFTSPGGRLHRLTAAWITGLAACSMAWAADPLPAVGDDIATGAQLAAKHCAACHGANGQGATTDFPSLAGQNEKYIAKQLRDFASGQRDSTVMDMKAAVLSECSIRAVSRFYQSQQPQVKPAKDPMLANAGAFVYERGNPYTGLPACVSCHGTGGRGNAELPRLAGQHPLYIERQLKKFVDRSRVDESAVMNVIASRMSEMEMKAVVEYLGALK